jgi:hypothetical protein
MSPPWSAVKRQNNQRSVAIPIGCVDAAFLLAPRDITRAGLLVEGRSTVVEYHV